MSGSLTETEKRYLEALLKMDSGYVIGYTDATFTALFKRHKVNINEEKYKIYGSSKAKKMRAFWAQETDALVGAVLIEVLDFYKVDCAIGKKEVNTMLLEKSKAIVTRLIGKPFVTNISQTSDEFMRREFTITNIQKLPIETLMVNIVENRLKEALIVLEAGGYLSTIFLCGSVLEAVLLGAAQQKPQRFNTALVSPKDQCGKVKKFENWSLAQLIDVACELGLLKLDVQKFSHGLRDFRNYIHPYQQMTSKFTPDKHTAKLCFQVLKAALADITGERG